VGYYCEAGGLLGQPEPRGRLSLLDSKTGKTVLEAKLEASQVKGADQITVFADAANYYFAFHVPSDNTTIIGEAGPNFQGFDLTVPVNGRLYAFNRATGNLAWFRALDHQQIVLEQQEDLPILICTTQVNRALGAGQGVAVVTSITCAIDKRTGKLFYRQEAVNANNTGYQPFHSVRLDRRTGAIELVSQSRKLRFQPKSAEQPGGPNKLGQD
jgi:outer membrane protein assembly factor BamB